MVIWRDLVWLCMIFYGLVCVESMKMGLLGVWQGVVLGG